MARLIKHSSRVVRVDLAGDSVRALAGSMVAYEGDVAFKKAGFGGGEGIRGAIKRKATGESLDLMECTGHGIVYLANAAQEVEVVDLNNDRMQVESSSLLALDGQLRTDVTFTGLTGASTGQGVFTTTITGYGQVAVLSEGPLIALGVQPGLPVVVDPDAYLASMGNLQQSFVTDVSWKAVIGEGSGEAFSLRFDGHGIVMIQPAER